MKRERTVNLLVVHCSAVRPHQTSTVEQITRWHKQRGFQTIGYHWVVYRDGSVHAGRPEWEVGAHVAGHNRNSIGVCYEGGLDALGQAADTRTPAQRTALRALLHALRERYPQARIVGHRDLSPDRNGDGIISRNEWTKRCPCFDAAQEYADLCREKK